MTYNFRAAIMAPLLAAAAMAGGTVPAAMAQAGPRAGAVRDFDIPAGPLGEALLVFGQQSGLQVTAQGPVVEGRTGAAVSGSYVPADALSRLLAGTGLTFRFVGRDAVQLEPAPQAGTGAINLGAVRVEGAGPTGGGGRPSATSDPASTEGTGTYAARAATIFKGAKSLREIPQSVSVLTREQIDDQGLVLLRDIFIQLPGVRVDGALVMEPRVRARGFLSSIQFDGVPANIGSDGSMLALDPAIYDRVEMLRGSSGLISGSGEPGGTVNLVRKRPRKTFGLAGTVSYASWNDARAELDVTGALDASGLLRGRILGVLQGRDYFYDEAHERRKQLYAMLEYDLTPDDTLRAAGTLMRLTHNPFYGLPRFSDGSLPGRKAFVGFTSIDSVDTARDAVVDYLHSFGSGWQIKATFNHREDRRNRATFYGQGNVNVLTGLGNGLRAFPDDTTRYTTFDVNASGPFDALGRTHQFTLGYNRAVRRTAYDTLAYTALPGVDVLGRFDWGGTETITPAGFAESVRQSGVYASLNLRLLEPLSLIVSGRFTDYLDRSRGAYGLPWVDGRREKGEFTPQAGIVFDVGKQVSLYGSYAEIFVPQTQRNYAGETLPPRTGEQFELGVKGEFFDGAVNASLSVYQLRDVNRAIRDIDPTHVCPGAAGQFCSVAGGKVRSRGVEAEVSGSPVPGLNLSASYAFNKTIYLSDTNPANVGAALDPMRNPRHLFKLWAQYRFADAGHTGALAPWSVGAGVNAQSSVESPPFRQDSYAIVSANLGYRFGPRADLTLAVDNLLDHTYLENAPGDGWGYYAIYGEPRSFRATFRYRFE